MNYQAKKGMFDHLMDLLTLTVVLGGLFKQSEGSKVGPGKDVLETYLYQQCCKEVVKKLSRAELNLQVVSWIQLVDSNL